MNDQNISSEVTARDTPLQKINSSVLVWLYISISLGIIQFIYTHFVIFMFAGPSGISTLYIPQTFPWFVFALFVNSFLAFGVGKLLKQNKKEGYRSALVYFSFFLFAILVYILKMVIFLFQSDVPSAIFAFFPGKALPFALVIFMTVFAIWNLYKQRALFAYSSGHVSKGKIVPIFLLMIFVISTLGIIFQVISGHYGFGFL